MALALKLEDSGAEAEVFEGDTHAACTEDADRFLRAGAPISASKESPVTALSRRRFSTSGKMLPRTQSDIVGCDTPSCLASAA